MYVYVMIIFNKNHIFYFHLVYIIYQYHILSISPYSISLFFFPSIIEFMYNSLKKHIVLLLFFNLKKKKTLKKKAFRKIAIVSAILTLCFIGRFIGYIYFVVIYIYVHVIDEAHNSYVHTHTL
jgi:hypothetical protein